MHLATTGLLSFRGRAGRLDWRVSPETLYIRYLFLPMEKPDFSMYVTLAGLPVKVSIHTDRYAFGDGLAVWLVEEFEEMDFAMVSVNVEGVRLGYDEFVFKTDSENEGLLEEMLATSAVTPTGRSTDFGPICRLMHGNDEKGVAK
jgi:hypothetical protein